MEYEKQREIVLDEINKALKKYDEAVTRREKIFASGKSTHDSSDWIEVLHSCILRSSAALTKIDFAKKLDLINFDEYLNFQNLYTDITLKGSD